MSVFLPLNTRKFQSKTHVVTPDTIYWDRLAKPELLKEHSTIDYIDFSPSDPDNFVLTCSVRVQVYNLVTKLVVKNLSRFQKTAYGATFRQDGRLLAAGDEEGHVKLFDTTSRNILRLFKGHSAPVHRTMFTADKLQIASFADDKSVRLWDVSDEKCVKTYEEAHQDYIRAGAMHPQTPNMFVSGGYDGKINLFDTRSANAIVQTMDHGSPVESLLFLPNGSIFISAGGTQIRVWDMVRGCRLLTMISPHHKTVTALRLGSDGRRLFSAGLDRHVKIFDVSSYKTVHTLTYPNAVVSLGVAQKDQAVVAGMVDGLVSIKRMIVDSRPRDLKQIRNSHRGKPREEEDLFGAPPLQHSRQQAAVVVDHVVRRVKQPKLQPFDKHLKAFNYKKALDSVLTRQNCKKQPELIVTVISEMLHRKSLEIALTDRPEHRLLLFINFLCSYVGEAQYMRTLLNAATVLLNVFEKNVLSYSEAMVTAFERLSTVMHKEVLLTMELMQLKGSLDMLIGASVETGSKDSQASYLEATKPCKMQPSKAAEKYVVIVD